MPLFEPKTETKLDVECVFEIWTECLTRSGGPHLFGEHFGIVDAMYYPVVTRFCTYGIILPSPALEAHAQAVEATPAVQKLVEVARKEPNLTLHDKHVRKLGGDPDQALDR